MVELYTHITILHKKGEKDVKNRILFNLYIITNFYQLSLCRIVFAALLLFFGNYVKIW